MLDALEGADVPAGLRELPRIATLRQTWHHHYERLTVQTTSAGHPVASRVRFKTKQELPQAAEEIQSPYDPDARYRHKRETSWVQTPPMPALRLCIIKPTGFPRPLRERQCCF